LLVVGKLKAPWSVYKCDNNNYWSLKYFLLRNKSNNIFLFFYISIYLKI
jgi:hypothetical protein